MAKAGYGEQPNKGSKLQWFLLVIVIPIIFLIVLTLIIMTVAGKNVFEMAQQIPGVESLVTSEEEAINENKINELMADVADKSARIEQLEGELAGKDDTIEELNEEILALQTEQESEDQVNTDQEEMIKSISASFKDIDAEEAAPIIEQLDEVLAVSVLEKVPNEERGLILAAMDPEKAANLTSAFINRN
ncbi:MotE family protein [Thalassobacillus hwangdonensis]|uniref:MotE family protein n=1 Tax=Thalassobacillus hwangdonensis TaxID=546108 RepID=A0ABW3KY69_9BACI